ncbi:MAG: hypothetical protein GF346_06540 [Candidatus Eisenbacteria bacterium]|nr:hypothetical protein [Candidatus Latescibacterota bacterium]MBD3302085.1 hypothetical protein [Candidatus Eisenbacteria bacterium]
MLTSLSGKDTLDGASRPSGPPDAVPETSDPEDPMSWTPVPSRPSALVLSALPALLATMLLVSPADADFPLPATPDWESDPNGHVATGLGVADLDGDGWVDLVVANGNDISRQRLVVYRNQGGGVYPADPTWSSSDVDYHGHLDLADVDGDGNLDCAVAVYLGPGGFGDPGRVKLYAGNGDGTFSDSPVWTSGDDFYCFSLSFGDLDNDGDPDLACATGDDYYNHRELRRIYRNVDGTLESLPSWTSQEEEYSLDVVWGDFNGDGEQDVAFAGTSNPNRIYFTENGVLQTSAGWSSEDASIWANTAAAGDVDGDGHLDLAIADNSQLGGNGRHKLYRNLGNGTLSAQPVWESSQGGYGSHVSFIDLDEDGDLDLATGRWWGSVQIFENQGGSLDTQPAYSSATSSVIENEVWEDADNDGLQLGIDGSFTGDGARRLYRLPERPAREILSVTIDGTSLDPAEVYLDSDDAWFVLPEAPQAGARIRVVYVSSVDLDLAVSNWDSSVGNYSFLNTGAPTGATLASLEPTTRLAAGPNPFDESLQLRLDLRGGVGRGTCEVVDPAGRRIRSWSTDGVRTVWDGRDERGRPAAPGVYWVRWTAQGVPSAVVRVTRR